MEYLATTDRLRSSEIALRFRRNIRQNIESNLKKKKKKNPTFRNEISGAIVSQASNNHSLRSNDCQNPARNLQSFRG